MLVLIGLMTAMSTGQATRPTTRPANEPLPDAAQTQPATRPSASFPDPQQLLADLGSSDWRLRRRAREQLVRLGEEAKPFIHQLIESAPTEEARSNAAAAIAQIDENRVLGPSYLTLHVKNALPADVFAEISRQCFAPIPTMQENLWDQGGYPRLTLDVEHKPFWEVVPAICQHFGVNLSPDQHGLRLMRGGLQMQGLSHVEGPFLIIANQISYSRTRLLGPGQREHSNFGLNMSIYPEPKITVIRGGGVVELDEVVDDHGNSLIPPHGRQNGSWGGFVGFGGWNIYAPLQYPAKNPGTKIVRFRGSTSFNVQTKFQELRIDDVLHMRETNVPVRGIQITLLSFSKKNGGYELKLLANQPNFASPEWQLLMEQIQFRLRILDSRGNELDHRGMSTNASANRLEISLEFGSGPGPANAQREPARLLWDIPTESKSLTVPIIFNDIPLFD
jgi:hypothetical protein